MKDFLIKSTILFLVALFESVVGLPILLSGLFLFWVEFDDEFYQISWIIGGGVLLGLFWGLSLWLGVLLMFFLSLVFWGSKEILPNKNLRIVLLTIFFGWLFFTSRNFIFNFRFLVYSAISVGLLILLQRLLVEKFEKKYL